MSDGSENDNGATYLNFPEDIKHVITERDFVSMLIDLYRNRPVLWKVKHPKYCDKIARAAAVQGIVQELQQFKPDFDEDKFKKKINTIRTNFNKQRHKLERAQAAGVSTTNHLWYFNELLFLLDQDDDDNQEADTAASNIADDSNAILQDSNATIEEEEVSPETEQKYVPKPSPTARPRSSRLLKKRPFISRNLKNITVKRRKVIEPAEEEDERIKKDDHQGVENSDDETSQDPEQYMTITTTYYKKPKTRENLLAEIWAKKLKKLSPKQKLYAEKIINDVLYEGELGNLSRNGVSFNPAF